MGPFVEIKGVLHQQKPKKHEDAGTGLDVMVRNVDLFVGQCFCDLDHCCTSCLRCDGVTLL